tara:strand:+ start:329 stop:673 length:345 start_codon:yes stop_codon:yes gene_type:complete
MQTKKPCDSCKRAFTKRERSLGYFLVGLLCAAVVYWLCATFKDYNRYSLHSWPNLEQPIMYKLDKRTGTVTVINQLWEFETQKFSDPDKEAKHWAFPNRQSLQNESDLLHFDWQ